MMSVRGSSPKMPSDRVTDPASLPSSVVTFISMSRALLCLVSIGLSLRRRRAGRGLSEAELARLGDAIGQLLFHRVAHGNPATLDARHRAFDQDHAARDVGLHYPEIECGHPIHAEMARHFFVLEGSSGVLPATGRADRAGRDRNA